MVVRNIWRERLICAFLLACGLLVAPTPALAQNSVPKRLALVIGNDAYQNVPKLEKAGNDAAAMARELKTAGFDVTLARDQDFRSMLKKMDFFISHITGGDQVVIFFAGHGVQLKTGNYLLPTDIETNSETEVEKTSISLNDVMDRLNEAKAAFALVMVDACRDNPLKSNGRAMGGTRGLQPPEPPKGQMVIYSASKGQQALDKLSQKDKNPNGVFTREFIARMRKPGVRIEDLVREVQDSVESLAKSIGHEQRPALYNEARGNFYFFGPTVVEVTEPVAQAAYSATPEKTAAQIDDEAWDSVKDGIDVDLMEEYLRQFPKGRHVGQARIAIVKFKAEAKRAAAVAPPIAAVTAAPVLGTPGNPKLESSASAKARLAPAFRDCNECPDMVAIPAGSFLMGNSDKSGITMRIFSTVTRVGKGADKEKPAHQVQVHKFAIGKTPVTQAQWVSVMGSNPSEFSKCGADCPVDNISWNDAKEFVRKLSAKTKKPYRLPSEAEWEYACTGGNPQPHCGGEDIDVLGWYKGNSGKAPHRVASMQPNAFGLFDMSGNVWQWVEDGYHSDYVDAPNDGSVWKTDDENPKRVLRGGSWSDDANSARSLNRNRDSADSRENNYGLRVARAIADGVLRSETVPAGGP
jgi:formylglycine-generating enzyme required for sulfatase activity